MERTQGKLVGKGSYGKVYLAPQNPNFPDMAVKSASGGRAASLCFEYQTLSRFRNVPGIIQCLHGGFCENSDGRTAYNLFMEYTPGGSLSDLIAEYGGEEGTGIPENHVRVYTRMILQALSTVHSRGYAHCDIKPGNILVFPAGEEGIRELKIADFGLALERRMVTPGSNNYRGTPRYLPPEVVMSGTASPAMDIWALGCTVVEMLTGEMPWAWLQEGDVLTEIRNGRRPEIPGWLSEEGKDFLSKCFAGNAIDRLDTDSFLKHPFVASNGRNAAMTKKKETTVVGQMQQQQKQRRPVLPHEFSRRPVLLC